MKTIPAYKILHALDWAEMAQRFMKRDAHVNVQAEDAIAFAVKELRSILVELDIQIDETKKEAA